MPQTVVMLSREVDWILLISRLIRKIFLMIHALYTSPRSSIKVFRIHPKMPELSTFILFIASTFFLRREKWIWDSFMSQVNHSLCYIASLLSFPGAPGMIMKQHKLGYLFQELLVLCTRSWCLCLRTWYWVEIMIYIFMLVWRTHGQARAAPSIAWGNLGQARAASSI